MNDYFKNPCYLAPTDNSKAEENFRVLTDRETVRTLAKNICNKLHHPVTIFDINRLQENSSNNVRIDSDIDYFSLRNSCRLLRHCGSEERCHACDTYHAQILKNYLDVGVLKCENWPKFFYDGYEKNPPQILQGFNRPVLEYHCPMLGYRELLFPIYYEKDLIGVLFVGQTLVESEGDRDKVKIIANDFFNKRENEPLKLFAEFLLHNKNFLSGNEPENIEKLIKTADEITKPIEEYLSFPMTESNNFNEQITMTFKDISDYYSFINKACYEIEFVEKELKKILNKKKKKYFNTLTESIVLNYFEKLTQKSNTLQQNIFVQRSMELKFAWDELIIATEELKKLFNINEIFLFGDGTSLKMVDNRRKSLYNPLLKEKNPDLKWFFDFSAIKSTQIKIYGFSSSLDDPQILNGLSVDFDTSNCILILYSDIAMLLLVDDLENKKSTYKRISDAIGKEFVKIRFSIALSTANLMEERQLLTLRMNKHESSHISTRLIDNMKRYFARKGQVFTELDREKQEDIVEDMYNTIKLISHMSNNIGILTGTINSDKIKGKSKKLDVFDLLYRWQIMFRDRLTDRNLDYIVLRGADNQDLVTPINMKDAPRNIMIYPELFELIVYNLIDNAVKYAYRGTTIYLSWRTVKEGYMLSVSSFGPPIKEDEHIYDLYVRGESRHWNTTDGDGIGLFVVKQAGKLLNIEINHDCLFVSKYNLPLIDWYLNERFEDKERKGYQVELFKLQKTLDTNLLNVVLNNNERTRITEFDISPEYLDSRINRETWLTTFEVLLPDTKHISLN